MSERPGPRLATRLRPSSRLLVFCLLVSSVKMGDAYSDSGRGATRQEPITVSLLVDYYERLLGDRDVEAFRRNVSARYLESSLTRLVDSPDLKARRAAVLALGLVGSIETNASVAKALRDGDPVVRSLGESALWAIWFRADSAENNATLEKVAALVTRQKFEEARTLATKLIDKAPGFAEAYNQRAIAEFFLGRFEESAEDCKRVIERNRFHTGALSGLAKCQLQLDRRDDALKSLRLASGLQPYNEDLRQTISALETGGR